MSIDIRRDSSGVRRCTVNGRVQPCRFLMTTIGRDGRHYCFKVTTQGTKRIPCDLPRLQPIPRDQYVVEYIDTMPSRNLAKYASYAAPPSAVYEGGGLLSIAIIKAGTIFVHHPILHGALPADNQMQWYRNVSDILANGTPYEVKQELRLLKVEGGVSQNYSAILSYLGIDPKKVRIRKEDDLIAMCLNNTRNVHGYVKVHQGTGRWEVVICPDVIGAGRMVEVAK